MRNRSSLRLCVLAMGTLLGLSALYAQERSIQTIQSDSNETLLSLPDHAQAIPGTYTVNDVDIKIERHPEMLLYKVVDGKREVKQWVSDTDKFGRFAYNVEKERFERLTNTIHVTMNDYSKVDAVVRETKAVKGKSFPELDFAVLHLPKELNPSKVVKEISDHIDVKTARVQVEGPRQIPL